MCFHHAAPPVLSQERGSIYENILTNWLRIVSIPASLQLPHFLQFPLYFFLTLHHLESWNRLDPFASTTHPIYIIYGC